MKAIELFKLQLERAEKLLEIHKTSYPKGRPAIGEVEDLLRMVVVFAVAALDAYMHRRVIESLSIIMDRKKRLSEKCTLLIGRQFKQEEKDRELIKIALKRYPKMTLLGKLERALAGQTFQKPEQINLAFDMMEITNPWHKVNNSVNPKRGPKRRGRKKDAKMVVLKLAQRRDDIVHEGDFYVGKKHHGKVKKIQRLEVDNQLIELRRIVGAIERISEPDKQEGNEARPKKVKKKSNV